MFKYFLALVVLVNVFTATAESKTNGIIYVTATENEVGHFVKIPISVDFNISSQDVSQDISQDVSSKDKE